MTRRVRFFRHVVAFMAAITSSYIIGGVTGRGYGERWAVEFRDPQDGSKFSYTSIKLMGDAAEKVGQYTAVSATGIALIFPIIAFVIDERKGKKTLNNAEWNRYQQWLSTPSAETFKTDRELWEDFKTATLSNDAVAVGEIENRVKERYGNGKAGEG